MTNTVETDFLVDGGSLTETFGKQACELDEFDVHPPSLLFLFCGEQTEAQLCQSNFEPAWGYRPPMQNENYPSAQSIPITGDT